MNAEFMMALTDIEKEKGISKEFMLDAIEAALTAAYKRDFGPNEDVRVAVDRETGDVAIFRRRKIVEEVEDPSQQISLADAKARGKSGVCMLGAEKQKAWLSDQTFAEKYGFETVDTTPDGYRLMALSFDGTKPRFAENAKRQEIENQELTIYYSSQCPYIHQSVELVRKTCGEMEVPYTLIPVDTLEKAKALPCVFNNWAAFYRGKFVTVNLLDAAALKRLVKK